MRPIPAPSCARAGIRGPAGWREPWATGQFIARADSELLPYNQTIRSPKGEQFVTSKEGGLTYTRPVRPFSLLPYRNELQRMGLDYMVVDLSRLKTGKKEMEELADRLTVRDRLPRLPTFNYLGTLE